MIKTKLVFKIHQNLITYYLRYVWINKLIHQIELYMFIGYKLTYFKQTYDFSSHTKILKPVFIYFFRKYLTDDLSLLQRNI